ncbi:hypothetical protein P152DRAFT_485238 [Eremomyces bilateralis CBS 781.70]|uniref:Inner centromere protein ARK-binding domain-containing protein n=1 Tax=Eremomyces bilateralis CBS 781.70 TaxID=1392243 RepID=A0A6G1FSN1_9PEZI|nr:uncharacterized protein P152DRAFT_485238 [Eremomyces bilateralis CBS 781.70]KAF1808689.1 hypothetical protein P152DRAFT_485238 [Eremomyces bilateralis CBS 781.70]
MTMLRSKASIGSAQWLLNENEQAQELIDQEVEEFSYSVRNDLEWLNEHMNDVFSGRNINVTDVFKTPGKLRGKTPRTARKRNALEKRAPLSDLFAPNPQANPSPLHKSLATKNPIFQVAEDIENRPPTSARKSPNKAIGAGKENVDSGYHEPSHYEMHVDPAPPATLSQSSTLCTSQQSAIKSPVLTNTPQNIQDRDVTDDSFVSAKEDLVAREAAIKAASDDVFVDKENLPRASPRPQAEPATAPEDQDIEMGGTGDENETMDVDGTHSPSDGSSPVKPLLRKSSMTFAALPGREPHMKSIGGRTSGTNPFNGRSSQLGRFTGGKSLGGPQLARTSNAPTSDHMDVDDDTMPPSLPREESETTRMHHKTSTQRLADKINMLGKSKEPRASKSITVNPQPQYPNISSNSDKVHSEPSPPPVPPKDVAAERELVNSLDDEDDWIAPVQYKPLAEEMQRPQVFKTRSQETIKTVVDEEHPSTQMPIVKASTNPTSPSRPGFLFGHGKSVSSSAVPSPLRPAMALEASHKKAFSVSNPDLRAGLESTTPAGSPTGKRFGDGPLSASKAKLYSVLKSAKGIFASSAGISAQAKMEALSPMPSPRRERTIMENGPLSPNPNVQPTYALYPNLGESIASGPSSKSPSREYEGRRLRSSSEREREEKRKEKEAKEHRKMEAGLQKAREKESQRATAQKMQQSKTTAKAKQAASSIRSGATSQAGSDTERNKVADEMPPPPPPKSLLPTSQSKSREPRKLFKPSRENLKTRPAPVSIKLASQRIGQLQPSTAALSASLQDSLGPAPPSKQPGISTKASNPSLHSASSTGSIKGRPRALEAAMKKKEQDEKAAQRKAEQKRELEQRRQAKAEEDRRLEQQRKAAEAERAQQARQAAQKKAEEARRRQEQQRKDAMRPPSRPGNDLASALQQEKSHGHPPHPRSDLTGPRPMSTKPGGGVVPHVNPAKPPKRLYQQDAEDESAPRPVPRQGPPFQQLDTKRRKTEDIEDEDVENRRSVMAPPIRQSNIRKEPSKFTHGYVPATQAPAHAPSMFKSAVTAQHNLQHGKIPDNAKFASGRIPFADAPNPPAGPSNPSHAPQQFKTPGRPAASTAVATTSKSSPALPPGESIALPEIATDSEDEDSENEFVAPSWVNSPALNSLLQQQQLVDPEQIFGPIAPLQMEEIFKNKDRHKRFRDRTSSANWSGNDRLTEEERRKDREAREKLVKEGGWSFHQNP